MFAVCWPPESARRRPANAVTLSVVLVCCADRMSCRLFLDKTQQQGRRQRSLAGQLWMAYLAIQRGIFAACRRRRQGQRRRPLGLCFYMSFRALCEISAPTDHRDCDRRGPQRRCRRRRPQPADTPLRDAHSAAITEATVGSSSSARLLSSRWRCRRPRRRRPKTRGQGTVHK